MTASQAGCLLHAVTSSVSISVSKQDESRSPEGPQGTPPAGSRMVLSLPPMSFRELELTRDFWPLSVRSPETGQGSVWSRNRAVLLSKETLYLPVSATEAEDTPVPGGGADTGEQYGASLHN